MHEEQLMAVLSEPRIYNDSRDKIIGNFNKLLAMWGTGKAYYNASSAPLELTDSMSTHRFKAIGYAEIKTEDGGSDGNNQNFAVLLKSDVDETKLRASFPQIEQNLRMIFNNASCSAKIENCKIQPDNKVILTISLFDTTTYKKYPASDVLRHLSQPQQYNQLNQVFSNNLIQLIPLQPVSKKDVDEYLNTVPAGIDPKVWDLAKQSNPDPKKFIPIPMIGFQALNERFKMQQHETQQQSLRLAQLSEQVAEIHKNVLATKSKLDECRRRRVILGDRVLKVLIKSEIENRRGFPLQADEEKLKSRLENILSELHAKTNFRGCLNELMSQLKQIQAQQQRSLTIILDQKLVDEIIEHSLREQEGIEQLIEVINQDKAKLAKPATTTLTLSSTTTTTTTTTIAATTSAPTFASSSVPTFSSSSVASTFAPTSVPTFSPISTSTSTSTFAASSASTFPQPSAPSFAPVSASTFTPTSASLFTQPASTFAQPATASPFTPASTFTQPASASPFTQPTAASPFTQAASASPFSQASTFAQPTSASPFTQPTSTFAQPTASPFAPTSAPTFGFGQPLAGNTGNTSTFSSNNVSNNPPMFGFNQQK